MAMEKEKSDCHAWKSPRKMEVMKMCVGGCPSLPLFAQCLLRPPNSAKLDRVSLRSVKWQRKVQPQFLQVYCKQ